MFPLIGNVQKRQIHWDRKWIRGRLGLEWGARRGGEWGRFSHGRRVSSWGDEMFLSYWAGSCAAL